MSQSANDVPVTPEGPTRVERYAKGVRFVAPILPATASAAMFIAYLLPAPLGRDAASSVLIGLIAALVVTLLGAALAIPLTQRRDAGRSFLELWERCQRLEARLEVVRDADKAFKTDDERATARLAISDIERIVARLKRSLDDGADAGSTSDATPSGSENGSRDVGLVGLWHLVHAAEEALLLVEPMTEVIAQALVDRRRLVGSTIPQAPALLAMQGAAVHGLDKAIAETYFASTTESASGGPGK